MKVLIILVCVATVAFSEFTFIDIVGGPWEDAPKGLDCDDANFRLALTSQYRTIEYFEWNSEEFSPNPYHFPFESLERKVVFCVLGNENSIYDMYILPAYGPMLVREGGNWGSLSYPSSITYGNAALDIDPDGTIWVASAPAVHLPGEPSPVHEIYHLSSGCDSVLSQWPIPEEMMNRPNGLARFNYQGIEYLALTSYRSYSIHVCTLDGQYVNAYSSPIPGLYNTYDITFSERMSCFFWSCCRTNGDGFIGIMVLEDLSP